jgi:hypothetical protein
MEIKSPQRQSGSPGMTANLRKLVLSTGLVMALGLVGLASADPNMTEIPDRSATEYGVPYASDHGMPCRNCENRNSPKLGYESRLVPGSTTDVMQRNTNGGDDTAR